MLTSRFARKMLALCRRRIERRREHAFSLDTIAL
jgi:hypothetical protein